MLPSLSLLIIIAVKLVRFVAGIAVVNVRLGSIPTPKRLVPSSPMAKDERDCCDRLADSSLPQPWAKKKSLDEELSFSTLALESPDTSFGVSALILESPPPKQEKKKGKKNVGFALGRNEAYEVENWFDR